MTTKTPTKIIDVMLDLETLGTKPGCKILQLSAATFNITNPKDKYFFDLYISPQHQDKLETDPKTLDWWQTEDKVLFNELINSPFAVPLINALNNFSDFLVHLDGEVHLWGCGANFDAPILAAAYNAYEIPVPWRTKNERCFRTLREEFGHLVPEPAFVGKKHNALHDAVYQAKWAEAIFKHIRPYNNGEY